MPPPCLNRVNMKRFAASDALTRRGMPPRAPSVCNMARADMTLGQQVQQLVQQYEKAKGEIAYGASFVEFAPRELRLACLCT